MTDPVKHPEHYTSHPSGVECIDITKHHNFCVGNAIKYLWRAGLKVPDSCSAAAAMIQDLQKAREYIAFEIERCEEEAGFSDSALAEKYPDEEIDRQDALRAALDAHYTRGEQGDLAAAVCDFLGFVPEALGHSIGDASPAAPTVRDHLGRPCLVWREDYCGSSAIYCQNHDDGRAPWILEADEHDVEKWYTYSNPDARRAIFDQLVALREAGF